MSKTPDRSAIYRRTDGRCHICQTNLTFKNYGKIGVPGCWEIDHSVPRARGGTDRRNNFYAACASCNRSKGARSTRSARGKNGHTRAPYSRAKKAVVRRSNALAGAVVGALVGLLLGPIGVLSGCFLGAIFGDEKQVR